MKAHAILRPRQIGQDALVMTVDASCSGRAERTRYRGLGRTHPQSDPGRDVIDRICVEVQRSRIREYVREDSIKVCGDENGDLLIVTMRLLKLRRP